MEASIPRASLYFHILEIGYMPFGLLMSFPGEDGFVRVDAEDDYDAIGISNSPHFTEHVMLWEAV